jgi:hypothetical protein
MQGGVGMTNTAQRCCGPPCRLIRSTRAVKFEVKSPPSTYHLGYAISDCHPGWGELRTDRNYGLLVYGF